MKTIRRIAKTELLTMFYSPVAWLVLVLFAFQSGLLFADVLHGSLVAQDSGMKLHSLTNGVFTVPWGFFPNIETNLYLYVPLLTMGLMSREISSGSIKLMLSSPIKTSDIILGKFLAMMIYCALLISILLLVVLTADGIIVALDVKMLLSGLLGFYLLICAYSAIGLYMSSLTSYQVVAAISTLVTLAALNFVREAGQRYAIVRTVTYFLSLKGRTGPFISGLITSTNVLYFVLVIMLFLGLAFLKLRAGQVSSSRGVRTAQYTGWVALILLVGCVSNIPSFTLYYDATVTKSQTLVPASQVIARKVAKPITVTTYVNILDVEFSWMGDPERINNDLDFWQRYLRFIPDLTINHVYYYDTSNAIWLFKDNAGKTLEEVARKVMNATGYKPTDRLRPAEIRQLENLEPEEYSFVRKISAGGKSTFVRVFEEMDPQPGEEEMIAALKRLEQPAPKVFFVTGHYERSIYQTGDVAVRSFATAPHFRHSLINQGFDADTLSLYDREVPADVSALVIADPRTAFKPMELERLRRYIDRGGNLLIAGEPGKQDILNSLLGSLPVRYRSGVLIQQSKDNAPDFVNVSFAPQAGGVWGKYVRMWKDSALLSMPGPVGLQYADTGVFKVATLLTTNSFNTWDKMGPFAMDTGKVTYNPENGDVRENIPVALALSRKWGTAEQRIAVLGDADFMNNLRYGNPFAPNQPFMLQLFSWFSHGEFPIDAERPETKDIHLRMKVDQLPLLRWFLQGLVPGILLIMGTVLLIRRKRK